jgi:hypothetical protein
MPQNSHTSETRQYNVRMPVDLAEGIKAEGYRLTGNRRSGFSQLLVICAVYGWEAYLRGELVVEREPLVTTYRLVRGKR